MLLWRRRASFREHSSVSGDRLPCQGPGCSTSKLKRKKTNDSDRAAGTQRPKAGVTLLKGMLSRGSHKGLSEKREKADIPRGGRQRLAHAAEQILSMSTEPWDSEDQREASVMGYRDGRQVVSKQAGTAQVGWGHTRARTENELLRGRAISVHDRGS